MVTTIRAALSVALLLGFYLYALVAVVLLGALSLLAIEYAPGVVAGKVVWVTRAVPFAILVATWKVLRAGPPPAMGLALGQERAPGLWAQVRAIAAAMGTRAPDDVRLVPEANAAVHEDARLLGLRRGRRHLYVDVPLLQALTVDQVRAVLAHELGHYSQRHTRLGMLTYRGEEVADCRRTRRFPKTYRLWLHHGGTVTIRWGMESDELGHGYAAWDHAMKLLVRG